MVNTLQTFRLFLLGGLSAAAVSACAPSYQMSGHDASMQTGYGYSQSAYGYDESAGYNAAGYETVQTSQPTHRSRYGTELRGACDVQIHPCGMMAVVPVYPVYQYVIAPPEPEVHVVEAPQVYEPEPIPYIEPEPIPYFEPAYEPPVEYWPEPAAPVRDWKPLRK